MKLKRPDIAWIDFDKKHTAERIEKIRKMHEANPKYTQKDLIMVCFESKYMVQKYYKSIAINKTV